MLLNTVRFGEVEIDDSTILNFKNGIYGFEKLHRYAIINCEETKPIYWLQSIEDTDIALPIIDPFIIKDDYIIDVDDKEFAELGTQKEEHLLVYNVVVLPADITKVTVNLVAPIIINIENNQSKQIILGLERDNAIKYPIFDPLMKYYKEVGTIAGTN